MSGNGEVDQCPFCNAAWGDCQHIKLLLGLEAETSAYATPGRCACPSSKYESRAVAEEPAVDAGVPHRVDVNKMLPGSW